MLDQELDQERHVFPRRVLQIHFEHELQGLADQSHVQREGRPLDGLRSPAPLFEILTPFVDLLLEALAIFLQVFET